jgi:hypothetical protein
VNQHFWNETSEEELEQRWGELEAGPVVSVFHNLQAVTIEANLTSKVLLVEGFHWDLDIALVLLLVLLVVEGQVVFDWLTGESGLFVLAWSISRYDPPEDNEQWEEEEKSKEDEGLEASAEFVSHPQWDESEPYTQGDVGKVLIGRTFCRQRGIGNSWRL